MNKLLAALFASMVTSGLASAQTATIGDAGTANNPTQTEAEVAGPQDSIGTSGSSPTKTMIYESNQGDENALDNDASLRPAPGTFESSVATDVHKNSEIGTQANPSVAGSKGRDNAATSSGSSAPVRASGSTGVNKQQGDEGSGSQ